MSKHTSQILQVACNFWSVQLRCYVGFDCRSSWAKGLMICPVESLPCCRVCTYEAKLLDFETFPITAFLVNRFLIQRQFWNRQTINFWYLGGYFQIIFHLEKWGFKEGSLSDPVPKTWFAYSVINIAQICHWFYSLESLCQELSELVQHVEIGREIRKLCTFSIIFFVISSLFRGMKKQPPILKVILERNEKQCFYMIWGSKERQ